MSISNNAPGPISFEFNKILEIQVPIKTTDLLLTKALNPIITNNVSKNVVILSSASEISQKMLSSIKLYDAVYIGETSPTSEYSCQMIAAGLKDQYDIDNKRLKRNTFVENDYFSIVADEVSQGKTLIAFNKNWVLPAVVKYIEDNMTYQMETTVALREKMATYNSDLSYDQVPFLNGQKFELKDLTIHSFYDSAFTNEEGGKSEAFMIFAPVDKDEAVKIYLYLNRDFTIYNYSSYITVKDVPINKLKDFQYLFPVELKFIDQYAIISTDQMTRDKLEHIYEMGEVYFPFFTLDDLTGAFATYLLAERTFYNYSLRWERNILFIGLCGYIQALDLVENFGSVLNEIGREFPVFQELLNYETAVVVAKESNIKCFYHNGKYYSAGQVNVIDQMNSSDRSKSKVELISPLIAITQHNTRKEAQKYLQSFGYDVNPEPYSNNIDLGYRTYEIDGIVNTIYYYKATNKDEIELHEVNGLYNEEIRSNLELLLRSGYFFNKKMRNITKGYPDFIPSKNPVNRQLNEDPNILMSQLNNILRGSEN
jgi:hypothetical protein